VGHEERGLDAYYETTDSTQIMVTSFVFGIYLLLLHAYLLNELRSDMTLSQLKQLCLYEVFVNTLLPLAWLPELKETIHIQTKVIFAVRLLMVVVYGSGYCFAGMGQNVGRIMAGEKAS